MSSSPAFGYASPPPVVGADRTRWTAARDEPGVRRIPELAAIAIVHDASTTAVMMATPLLATMGSFGDGQPLERETRAIGSPILCGISAPTALAVRTAEEAAITLVAIARADGFEVFTHAHRIIG